MGISWLEISHWVNFLLFPPSKWLNPPSITIIYGFIYIITCLPAGPALMILIIFLVGIVIARWFLHWIEVRFIGYSIFFIAVFGSTQWLFEGRSSWPPARVSYSPGMHRWTHPALLLCWISAILAPDHDKVAVHHWVQYLLPRACPRRYPAYCRQRPPYLPFCYPSLLFDRLYLFWGWLLWGYRPWIGRGSC